MIPRNRREIRTDILQENMEKIRGQVPAGVKVLAVVKGQAGQRWPAGPIWWR